MASLEWTRVIKGLEEQCYAAISLVTPVAPANALWTGELSMPRRNAFQAELRWRCTAGQSAALLIVGLDGWDYKNETSDTSTAKPGRYVRDTSGFVARLSANGGLWFDLDQLEELRDVVHEARRVLAYLTNLVADQ